ncbi:MAG: tRNA guanosine(15) transglycosylase TgtA [Haloarculaceae archaeon]
MTGVFEVDRYDARGRLGTFEVPRANTTVETPALLPVVNPHVQTLEPSRVGDLGADILITNSYVLHGSDDLREPVLEQGVHDLLDFDGVVMTDSGSFQLAEYGEISVTTEEILAFQDAIGSDIGTPVDIPTPPEVSREAAEADLATTQDRLETAASTPAAEESEMLVTAPIQGSTYPDLRERAARDAASTGLDVFPVGAVVPLMGEYRFADLVDVVLATKRGLPESAPVHLFGAGHPMMFALAVAMGCDLFDSAAYALYARDGRYLTVRGTEHLADLAHFPCECPVCTAHDPAALQAMDAEADERQRLLAEHNLHVSFGEIRRVKQAIRQGDLLELVETRARAHPAMLDGYRVLLDHADELEVTDPITKDTFFHTSAESSRRPEVRRHHDRLARFDVEAGTSLLLAPTGEVPRDLEESVDDRWLLRPPFGPVPVDLVDAYPFTAEVPVRLSVAAYAAAVEGVCRLFDANPDVTLTVAHDGWPEAALADLPNGVEQADLE